MTEFYEGVAVIRFPYVSDAEHERMWSVSRPRCNQRRRYPADRLVGLCDRSRR